jgi:hypothetical protein
MAMWFEEADSGSRCWCFTACSLAADDEGRGESEGVREKVGEEERAEEGLETAIEGVGSESSRERFAILDAEWWGSYFGSVSVSPLTIAVSL